MYISPSHMRDTFELLTESVSDPQTGTTTGTTDELGETIRLGDSQQPESKGVKWVRGRDLNPRPAGYEPAELPDCSTPPGVDINGWVGSQRGRRTRAG